MSSSQPIGKQAAFTAMTSLFFIWGFITALNDILIPHLKAAFELNYTQAMLVQFAFFGAYFLVSPLAGKLIEKIGYLNGIIAGLVTRALGCMIFYPAAQIEVYGLFLAGLFVLAAGITVLQVAANPYVAGLGEQKTAASRLNLAQAVNSLGHTLAPLFGAMLIFGAVNGDKISPQSVQLPYLLLAGVIIATALVFRTMNLPVIETQTGDNMPLQTKQSIWSQRHCVLGAGAIFLYVGAEVSIGSFLVNYLTETNIAAMDVQQASQMVSYYWGAAMMGRFVGAALTQTIRPTYILAANAVLAVVLLLTTMTNTGSIAMYSVIAVGFFNSIMFPTIFALAIRNLGPLTSRGSGLLCQAIVGGAILPLVQGVVADSFSIQISFIVPMLAYFYIFGYAQYSHNMVFAPSNVKPVEAKT
jgi:FHS family L-fucose permease-like MFS transporter